jgi:hypothetical protein
VTFVAQRRKSELVSDAEAWLWETCGKGGTTGGEDGRADPPRLDPMTTPANPTDSNPVRASARLMPSAYRRALKRCGRRERGGD